MSDNNKLTKTIYVQSLKTLCVTVGVACSIPLASLPALAHRDEPRVNARPNQLDRLNRISQNRRDSARLNGPNADRYNDRGRDLKLSTLNLPGANFNLNSGREMFSSGNLGNFTNLTIDVGGRQKIVTLDTKLTAAEVVAAQQVLKGQDQTIKLGNNGAATGGTVSLDNDMLSALDRSVGGAISSVTVARDVQVIDKTTDWSISGTLRNRGTIVTAGDAYGLTNTISAESIINSRTGTIGSFSGSDLYAADVNLSADSQITNNGRISSANNLTLNAPTIYNVNDGSSQASVSAGQNIYLNTQNLINTGLVAATAGSVSVSSASDLAVINSGGTLQATNDDINFNVNSTTINLTGGNLHSQQVNFNAGHDGLIEASVDQVSGKVNATGCVVHLAANTDNLRLGDIEAFGDPIFTNVGNITIDGGFAPTNGAPLTIVAGGNVVSGAGNNGLDTSAAGVDGGDITVIAGALFKVDTSGNIIVSKQSATGGIIDFTGGSGGTAPLAKIDTHSGTADGGDVQLIAFSGSSSGSGKILIPGITVNLGGNIKGDFTAVAGIASGDGIVSGGDFSVNNATFVSANPSAKGGLVFDGTTGAQLSGELTFSALNSGNIIFNAGNQAIADGDITIRTGGDLFLNDYVGTTGGDITIAAKNLNINSTGLLGTDPASVTQVVNANISNATNVAGNTFVGVMNLTTGSLNIAAGGAMNDAFENITTSTDIVLDGRLGRQQDTSEQNAAPSTLNVFANSITINSGGGVSGNGTVTSAEFSNNQGGLGLGSIAYTVGGAKGGTFVNDGTIDGLHVTVNASTILNGPGANLQATLQTLPSDVPTLTLNTSLLDNLGHIEATGRTKLSPGKLTINGPGDLTITGVDGGFVTAFSSTVSLTAEGTITIGGNDGATNSNPFSALTTGMGNFKVKAGGAFESTISAVTVTANSAGENGNILIDTQSILYNGLGQAPVLVLEANGAGSALSIGQKPVTVILTDKKTGITVGSNPGNIEIDVNGFDSSSVVTLSTPTSLTVDMASLHHGGSSLDLTGTSKLLISGNIVGGDNVTLTTGGKGEFRIGDAIESGIIGITAGQGASAIKNLTINSLGPVVIGSGFRLASDEAVNINATGLQVNAGADVIDLHLGPAPDETLILKLDSGTASKALYANFNPLGRISAPIFKVNSIGTLELISGDSDFETVLTVATNPNSAGGLAGGGTFDINAGSLKFSPEGILFNAGSPGAGSPNGGEVTINLSTTKIVQIGLGKNRVRANVAASPGFDSDSGYGKFSFTSVGRVSATDVYNGGVGPFSIDFGFPAIGFGGSLELVSKATTVQIADVDGIGLNLFKLSAHSMIPMLLNGALPNGIIDIDPTFVCDTFSFTNRGQLFTNGVGLTGKEYNFTSSTVVDLRGNDQLIAGASGPPGQNVGGVINISGAAVQVNNQTGLTLVANGGADIGAIVNIKTTAPGGKVEIASPGSGGAIFIDVGNTQNNVGAAVSLDVGGTLEVDGHGLDFGASTNVGASLNLRTNLPIVVKPGKNGKPGKSIVLNSGNNLTINNADVITGLELGSVELSSTSNNLFLLSDANENNGNGLSGSGVITAGSITIKALNALGIGSIDAEGYAMVTNNLTIKTGTIDFAPNQIISVVADGAVGTGGHTGVGGTIDITSTALTFDSDGGVTLRAQGNAANPTSTGGTIKVRNTDTKTLVLGSTGLTFDVTDAGGQPVQKNGTVSVSQSLGSLTVDGTAFAFGANDGGNLSLEAGSMLISNVASLNPAKLDSVSLKTTGNGKTHAAFQFGSATLNGFSDVNPTLNAAAITIESVGKDAGIDTVGGNLQAGTITLNSSGNINFASGGQLSVLANAVNGDGGSIHITANGLTQTGGSAGFTLVAAGTTGAGGRVDVSITGSDPLIIGSGALNIDISNANGMPGGSVNVSSYGNTVLDFNAIDVGSNFGGDGPNLVFNANGVLAVNNMATIANVGIGSVTLNSRNSQSFVLGGAASGTNGIQDSNLNLNVGTINIGNAGSITTATIAGLPNINAGGTDTITVVDPSLPNGVVTISHKFVEGEKKEQGDTTLTIAAALADGINNNLDLQNIGVSATLDGSVITLTSLSVNTTYFGSDGSKIEFETLSNGGDIGNGNLNSLSGAATTAVTLRANGNIGTNLEPIKLNSPVASIFVNAGGDANILNTGGAQSLTMNVGGHARATVTGGDLANVNGTAGGFTLNYANSNALNTNSVSLTNIATTGGALLVSSNARDLIVDGSLSTTNGNIELVNTNQGAPTIQILDDTIIYASGDVTQINQGNVYISIGLIPNTFTPGVVPGGVQIDQTQGGQVTFGSPANLTGTITANPNAIFQALGRDLAFNGSAASITVGQNVVITADPPSYVPTAQVLSGRSQNNNPMPLTVKQNTTSESASLLEPRRNTAFELPPSFNRLRLTNAYEVTRASNNHALSTTPPALVGEVSNIVRRFVENGPLLVAPQQDEVIDTPYGSVTVAAKSLVLIIASEKGLAVYNLHDVCKKAVTLTRNGHSVNITPGSHALFVGSAVESFEHANPAQFVRYRHLTSKPIDDATKLYRAEFDVTSMLNGLPAFKDLLASQDQETRKTMVNVLKTAAILMQLSQGGQSFKHFVAPEITASRAI